MGGEKKVKDENMSNKVEEELVRVQKEFDTIQKEKNELTAKLGQINTRLVELTGEFKVLTSLKEKKPKLIV